MPPSVHAQATPDKPALICAGSGEVVSYKTLDDRSNQVAQLLRALGLRSGDHIALMLENHPRWFEICWGAQRAGLIYTAMSTHPLGWTTLGDEGFVDADGYLYLTDRKAYMIISGGVNIYPQEAENVLINHPQVADCAVLGVPNEEFGEEVKAVVQPRDMRDAGPELAQALIAYCREHLSAIKCPKSVDFEAELLRHPTGKLYKRLLKDRYWAGHASKIV